MAQRGAANSSSRSDLLPMKATAGDLPVGGGWAFEIKWDGMRAIADIADGAATLWTSNGIDMTVRFPELQALCAELGESTALLDGEIVAFDGDHPSFGRLQARMHVSDPVEAARLATDTPVVYQVFDLLRLDGRELLDLPYVDRRRLLEAFLPAGASWQVPVSHAGDGRDLLDAVEAQGLEGLVAKRLDSRYLPGKRTNEWRKIKVRPEQEFVVGGWLPGTGSRSGRLGSLLVGYHEGRVLRYAGRVGTGLTDDEIRRLDDVLGRQEQPDCPFDPPPPRDVVRRAHWVDPTLVVQVAFAEWTVQDRLRHPSYRGRRGDKDAAEVTREPR